MKSRLLGVLMLILFALCGANTRSDAQMTGVSVDSLNGWDYLGYCYVPSNTQFHLFAIVSGTFIPSDSATIYLNYGDGTDTAWKVSVYANQGYLHVSKTHSYLMPGAFTAVAAVTTSNGHTDTLYSSTLSYTNSCAILSGDLYIDANNNCIKNPGETPLPWHLVPITTGSTVYYAISDYDGHYAIDVPIGGTYTLAPNLAGYNVAATCPSSGSPTVTVTSGGVTIDFPYSCNGATIDYSVTAGAGTWRPGFDRQFSVYGSGNNYCNSLPASITVTLPPLLSYNGTVTGPAPTIAGNTLTWVVTSLGPINSFAATVNIHTDVTAAIGDTICIPVTISTTPADANPSNNSIAFCRAVSNAFDPNDKSVTPKGSGENGDIVNGTLLTYLVNFQNTGNDVAYNVTVKDMIDLDLDLSTLKVLNTSHSMNMGVAGREVNFRFNNINLPDSAANEPASHGYILYTIKPKASLPSGRQITNTAHIYFDYNTAITTNTTLNTIATPQGVMHISSGTLEATVFPNPANGLVYMELSDNSSFNATLYDAMGRTVRVVDGINGRAVMSVKDMPEGVYFIRLMNTDNKILTTKVNIQH